jgi:spore germination cell wall hydrolase CwlJ-like protein
MRLIRLYIIMSGIAIILSVGAALREEPVEHIDLTLKAEPIPAQEIQYESTPVDLEEEQWYDSLEYLAHCVEAEAGNQSEMGKRLVCDVVLNRFQQGSYETFYDVIDEKCNGVYQFSVVKDGRIDTVVPAEDTYRIVREELEHQTNMQVLYFRTQEYHSFGTPLFKEGDHYFSK